MNYKNTHTTINARSNHPGKMKMAMIKGFGDSVRSLCDKDTLEDQLQNLEEIFMENGHEKEKIKGYLSEKRRK